ncbi:MAG: hypothetical protein GY780_17730 [bacterium]|nr:hypothetical protein [bacterium]
MAPALSTHPENMNREQNLFRRLHGLYEEERQIYGQVLELSRQQGELVRQGNSLGDIRQLLQKKNVCLEIIKRLEMTERSAKNEWEQGKRQWSALNQSNLNKCLQDVSTLIEEILVCEEKNDQEFIQQMRAQQ